MAVSSAMSTMRISGLDGVSAQMSFVFGRTALCHGFEIRHVDGRELDAPRTEDVAHQLECSEIGVVGRDDVAIRAERLYKRHRRGRAG